MAYAPPAPPVAGLANWSVVSDLLQQVVARLPGHTGHDASEMDRIDDGEPRHLAEMAEMAEMAVRPGDQGLRRLRVAPDSTDHR